MQAPPSQDEIDLYNEYWNSLSGNSNAQAIPDNIIVNFYKASNLNNQVIFFFLIYKQTLNLLLFILKPNNTKQNYF